MVGPVLHLELLLGSRRGKQYIFRWIYGGWLVVQLSFLYFNYLISQSYVADAASDFSVSLVSALVKQQFLLLLLATPAFTAGAITDEKSTGTLQYLMAADLTPAEILLGKLFGRLAQVALLGLISLPMLCFFGVFGGVDLIGLFALALTTSLALIAVGSASLLASVLSKHTRDAVLGLYALCGLAYALYLLVNALHGTVAAGGKGGWGATLLAGLDGLLAYFNPLYTLEPVWGQHDLGEFGRRLFGATIAWGSVAAGCLGLAVWRLRTAYLEQLEGAGKRRKARWWTANRQEIRRDPIRWKERQIEGIAPLPILRRVPGWLGCAAIFLVTTVSSLGILWSHFPATAKPERIPSLLLAGDLPAVVDLLSDIEPAGGAFMMQALVVMLLASLVIGIRCSGAVCGERERQTWEALLLTPLETRQLIRGKLWGILGASYPYLLSYAIPAIPLSVLGGLGAVAATVGWLAVTWLAMYFLGAAGIWCSVKAKTSWRSLLATLAFGYLLGSAIYVCALPLIFVLIGMIMIALSLLELFFPGTRALGLGNFGGVFLIAFLIASGLGLICIFFFMATMFLRWAEKRVADVERTRHWRRREWEDYFDDEEEYYRLRKRRAARKPRYYS